MDILIDGLIMIIAILHLFILWIEMFAWATMGVRIFKIIPKEIFPMTKSMAANQGLYNGFLAAGLIWSLLIEDAMWSQSISSFFLSCVAVAGAYGAMTVSKKIFFVQALPAIVCLLLILFVK